MANRDPAIGNRRFRSSRAASRTPSPEAGRRTEADARERFATEEAIPCNEAGDGTVAVPPPVRGRPGDSEKRGKWGVRKSPLAFVSMKSRCMKHAPCRTRDFAEKPPNMRPGLDLRLEPGPEGFPGVRTIPVAVSQKQHMALQGLVFERAFGSDGERGVGRARDRPRGPVSSAAPVGRRLAGFRGGEPLLAVAPVHLASQPLGARGAGSAGGHEIVGSGDDSPAENADAHENQLARITLAATETAAIAVPLKQHLSSSWFGMQHARTSRSGNTICCIHNENTNQI